MTNTDGKDVTSALVGPRTAFARKFPLLTKTALVLAWLAGPYFAGHGIYFAILNSNPGFDAHAYWLAGQGPLLYDKPAGQLDAYLYSPAFATVIRPLAMLDWPFFFAVWACLEAAVLVWLLKPLQLKWAIPLFLLSVPELVNGNIFILLAASAVIGTRMPAAWAFPVLTKITSGVGLICFVVRGEWRRLAQGIGACVGIAGVSYLFNPSEWQAWFTFLISHRGATQDGGLSFFLRCMLGAGVAAFGARKGWPWLIAPAMVLVSPVFALPTLTLLTAIPRLTLAVEHGRPGSSFGMNRHPVHKTLGG
ncbi:glycosyltransferase family 87 protein [Arthrobacter sp. 2MCAF14]|uniref:glycosyltransferase family 87 protein n=1 Tax=Arthrobacter sp. 2MCAF14 TaxID=3232982 RepID=UPI003F8DE230